MTCHHCHGSDCCHGWDRPRTCSPRRNWPWVIVAVGCLLIGCGLSLWGGRTIETPKQKSPDATPGI